MALRRSRMAHWATGCLLLAGSAASGADTPPALELTCPVGDRAQVPVRTATAAEPATPMADSDEPLPFAEFGLPDDHLDPALPTVLRDHLNFSDRLQSLRSVSLFRLWSSANLHLYLGTDRAGNYGLHFQRHGRREEMAHSLTAPPSDIALTRFGRNRDLEDGERR
jgi:hypothetical protein